MKLYSLGVYYKSGESARLLKNAFDLQQFNYFQRSSLQEFMVFISKVIIGRTSVSTRITVIEQGYYCNALIRSDGLTGICMCDEEYQCNKVFSVLNCILDDFSNTVQKGSWPTISENAAPYHNLDYWFQKFQDPNNVTMIQNSSTGNNTMKKSMSDVLSKDEKLDDLVERSHLSSQTKLLYRNTRKPTPGPSWKPQWEWN